MLRQFFSVLFGLVATIWVAPVCSGPLVIESAWLRAMPPGAVNSAAYLSLSNVSAQSITVIGIVTDIADKVEIHESMQAGGRWQMRAVESLTLTAGQQTTLVPGGKHLMVFGLSQMLREGEQVEFSMQLADARVVNFSAQVRRFAAASTKHH